MKRCIFREGVCVGVLVVLIVVFLLYFQNQPLMAFGRPKGDGEVRMISSVDKRKQDRLLFFTFTELKRQENIIKNNNHICVNLII